MPVLFPLKLDHESSDFGIIALGGAGYARLGTHVTDLALVQCFFIPSYLHKMQSFRSLGKPWLVILFPLV